MCMRMHMRARRRAADLLRACAAAHGRGAVSVLDLAAVLPHVLWDAPDEAPALAEWVDEHVLPDGGAEQLRFLLASLRARAATVEDADGGASDGGGGGGDGGDDGGSDGGGGALLAADVRALSAAALDAAAEMRVHARALEAAPSHVFLPPQAAARLRPRQLPRARARARELEAIAAAAAALALGIAEGAGGDVLALLGAADGEAVGGDDEGEGGAAPAAGFTDEELQWGRKEAKARLGAEAFKEWRKAARKAAK